MYDIATKNSAWFFLSKPMISHILAYQDDGLDQAWE